MLPASLLAGVCHDLDDRDQLDVAASFKFHDITRPGVPQGKSEGSRPGN